MRRKHHMYKVLAYMHLLIKVARSTGRLFTRPAMKGHGRKLDLLPSVAAWFGRAHGFCKEAGAMVEHFVISSCAFPRRTRNTK